MIIVELMEMKDFIFQIDGDENHDMLKKIGNTLLSKKNTFVDDGIEGARIEGGHIPNIHLNICHLVEGKT